ncbi:MAG: 4-hydroxybenzoate polyprenyltransferase [Bacteroidia bacterium]|jgi:4-hydroxybenzoate polyprenyltransferase
MTTSRSDLRISNLSVAEFINCFSLLVALGTISTSYFFGQIYHADLSFSFFWLLATTTWIIYTLDHILDGYKLKEDSISVRHLIHYKYRKSIVPTLAALCLFNGYLAWFFLPINVIWSGIIVSFFVGLYFGIVHLLKSKQIVFPKELFVSIIVAIGMVVLPGIVGDMRFSFESVLMVCSMACINYANLLLFSYYDYENDVKNGLMSAATHWGLTKTKMMIMNALALAFVLFTAWTFLIISPVKIQISIALLVMLNVLLVIYIQEERFAKKERYRFWGDFIFLVPGFVWWFFEQNTFF